MKMQEEAMMEEERQRAQGEEGLLTSHNVIV